MYLLPYDGSPDLLEDTAILRDKLFKELSLANPRSVTVFLDTCYSGTTRSNNMLISSRPIVIVAKEQAIPSNFTVFTAASGDQIAKPLLEAKHGLFSYFLMKGMEGMADKNNDKNIIYDVNLFGNFIWLGEDRASNCRKSCRDLFNKKCKNTNPKTYGTP